MDFAEIPGTLRAQLDRLMRQVRDQQARLDDRARRLQTASALERELKEVRLENRQLEKVVSTVLRRYFSPLPLPPEALRLHVGTRPTAANFWAQGLNSSEKVLEVFGECPTQPVLDWGCGSGRTLRWLHRLPAWRERYHGCDVDRAAIDWLSQNGVANVATCGDDPPLPYPDGSFGGVFAFSVLTHIHPERHRAWFAELRRVLRPGGIAYLTFHGRRIVRDTSYGLPAAYREEYEAKGFTYMRHEGHYKDAAVVSEAFTRQSAEGCLVIDRYQEDGYQNMDAILAHRPD